MNNKLLHIILLALTMLLMCSCNDQEKQAGIIFSCNLVPASIKPLGAGNDTLTYKSSFNLALLVNRDKKLQMIISDLMLHSDMKSLPVTLQLTSESLVITQDNVTTLHFTGKSVKSNLFVLSNIDGTIDFAQNLLTISFLLNGKQEMRLSAPLEPAALLETLKEQITSSLTGQ